MPSAALSVLLVPALLVCALPQATAGEPEPAREPVRVIVHDNALNPVDDRIFGQFMERASWGEPGYDAARDPDNPRALAPDVVEKLAWMDIPVVRWPAGSDLGKIDWTDMIDSVPGREGGRPVFAERDGVVYSNEFGLDEFLALGEELGFAPLLPIAVTEWNWNGWWRGQGRPLDSRLAPGIGAAGMLHAFMRRGDRVKIGCQSMLVGTKWGITAVRVQEGEPPRMLPTGQVTGLYSRRHGSERLRVDLLDLPTVRQPLRFNSITPAPRMATVDIVVTRGDGTLYLHAINRSMTDDAPVRFELASVGGAEGDATMHTLTGPVEAEAGEPDATITTATVTADGDTLDLTLPARSVSVIELPLTR